MQFRMTLTETLLLAALEMPTLIVVVVLVSISVTKAAVERPVLSAVQTAV